MFIKRSAGRFTQQKEFGNKANKAGKIAIATAATAGTAYGARKLYDKKKKSEEKTFSLVGNFKGNPELTNKLFGSWSNIKLNEEVIQDLTDLNLPTDNDFAKFMGIMFDLAYKGSYRISGPIKDCSFFLRGYMDILENLENPNHTGFGTLKYDQHRVVLGRVSADKELIVSYLPDTKKYIITGEYAKYDLIGRGVNKLFGGKRFEIIGEYSDFKSVLKYMTGVRVITVAY